MIQTIDEITRTNETEPRRNRRYIVSYTHANRTHIAVVNAPNAKAARADFDEWHGELFPETKAHGITVKRETK